MPVQKEPLTAVRLDRWLFSVRIFKSRSLAAKAISGGKIKIDGDSAKPNRLVRIGDEIQYKREGCTYLYKVTGLIEKRVGAKDAVLNYSVTENPDLQPEMREMLKLYQEMERKIPKNKGRPSKRDRRLIDKHKEHNF